MMTYYDGLQVQIPNSRYIAKNSKFQVQMPEVPSEMEVAPLAKSVLSEYLKFALFDSIKLHCLFGLSTILNLLITVH